MKIKTSPENDLVIEAENFRESRLLALTYQRLSLLRAMAQDAHLLPDRIWLEDTGKTLSLVWAISDEGIDQ